MTVKKVKTQSRAKTGRPLKNIDPEQVRKLAQMNGSYEEIAAVLGCDPSTLTRRFAQVIKQGREHLQMSLKRAQYVSGIVNGNVTMQIWLGKQLLGQKDQVEETHHTDNPPLAAAYVQAINIALGYTGKLEPIKMIEGPKNEKTFDRSILPD